MYVIIVAAGSGQRFASDTPKQFLEIAGKPVVQHCIDAFDEIEEIRSIVVVMPQELSLWESIDLSSEKELIYTTGDSCRAGSVLKGLKTLKPEAQKNSWILVHDAARMCVTPMDIRKLIDKCSKNNRGGLLVKPIIDTIKYSEDGKYIQKTINRENLYSALTPQMFPYKKLKKALKSVPTENITDEASAMELTGYKPLLVKGRSDNIKLTYADDLLLASFILRKRQ